jgi:hypothetical protein
VRGRQGSRFGDVSHAERRGAELFFVDLMGIRRRRRRPRSSADENWQEARALVEGPLTDSEWQTVTGILTTGEAQAGSPLTDDEGRNALLVAGRIFCDRNALNLDGSNPLMCVVPDVTLADGRVQALVPHVTLRGPIVAWPRVARDARILRVMRLLVRTHGYPVNAAAGLVGNLLAESGVIPQRLEGSREDTPMRAQDFAGHVTDFTADEIMNRLPANRTGPRLPGIGLAQWTTAARRAGLFARTFRGVRLGARILFDMEGQVDYLVSELRGGGFRTVETVLMNAAVTVDAASDEVVYNFEVPGAILSGGARLPRTDPAVVKVFTVRRALAATAAGAWAASS